MAIKFFNNVAVDSDVLYVDAVNNEVGIGTTNPLAKLQVNAGGSDISAQLGLDLFGSFKLGDVIANYAGGGIFYDGTPGSEDVQISTRTFRISGSSGEGIEGASNGDVYLRSQFGVLATIDASNNNFGIGTVDPSTKLEVEGGDGLLQLSTTSSTGSPYMSFAQAGARRSFIQHADSGDYLKLASEYGGINFFTGTGGTETEKMTILSGGNVGIGDTAPDAKLTVFRTDSTYAVNLSDTESRAGLSVKSSSSFDSKLTISSGASSRQYIQAVNNAATTGRDIAINPYGGNVGIGTTSPAQKLDVAGSVRVQDRLYTNANATNTVGILGKATVNGWGARYDSNNANFSGFYFDGSHHSLILGRNAAGTITNYIHASGNSYFNGGNVGIGNTSPTYLLDVNEDDNVLAFRVTGGGGGNPIASFVRDVGSTGASVNIGASSNFPQIQFVSTGNTFSIGADSSGNFKISDNTSIGTNDRITIDNIGNVGIGTSSPSQKLDVVGSIEVSDGVYIGGTSAANKLDDYEQGTFDLEWGYGVFGGISYYDLSDFGGNKSETSTYVKVGRHVTVTSVFRYGSLPTAWSQSFGVVYLKLPFAVSTGYYANGAYSAFPGSGAAGSPSLFPTNYSSAFSLLGLHKSGLGGFGTFQTLTVGDMPGSGPSGYAEFRISFSFYTTS